MSVDALEYLRAEDPVPHGSTAPPMDWVLTRIEGAEARPRRRRRIRFPLVPMVAVAATLAVVAVIVVLAVTHRTQAPAHVPPASRTAPAVRSVPALPSPGSLMPRGGMRGTVSVDGAASASAGNVVISFTQCHPCHGNPGAAGSATHLWQAMTTDGGTSWHVTRATADLSMLDVSGSDGWAEGLGSDRAARFFASHDGGRTWHVASSDAFAPGGVGDVSVAGGEVWTLGNNCTGNTCNDTILHALASADHLSRTAGQPPLGDATNVSVVATGRDDAYVLTGSQLFATHEDGRTWRRVAPACPARAFGRLYAGGSGALWSVCQREHRADELRTSTNGGEHWTTLPSRPGNGAQLHPSSAQVAWATSPAGKVVRTEDGGRTWGSVWYGGQPEPTAPTNAPPVNRAWRAVLAVQSPVAATVIVAVTRGHAVQTDFVTYRTTDGGRTWTPSAVRLPPG